MGLRNFGRMAGMVQAMAVIKIAMSYAQLCGNHVLKFFGSDGRDKGLGVLGLV